MKPKILVLANQKRENYINAVKEAGGIPLTHCPPFTLKKIDGLLLCGGNDVHPSYYGQNVNGAINFDHRRDKREFRITKTFLDTGKPILGICRGHQLLNVALGGTLIQDLENADFHKSRGGVDGVHSVEATGVMETLFGKQFSVNTCHHQAIDKLGAGLSACAVCDGVIEAVEHRDKPYLSVQFHPERMKSESGDTDMADGLEIFRHFIKLSSHG